MRIKGLKIHRVTSWLLVLFTLITVILGYTTSRRWLPNYDFYLILHLVIEWITIGLGIVHIILQRKYLKLKLRRIIAGFKSERAFDISLLRLIQRITKWFIVILAVFVVLPGLVFYPWGFDILGDFFLFSAHLDFDLFLLLLIIFHVGVGFKFYFTRKRIKHWSSNLFIVLLVFSLPITLVAVNLPQELASPKVRIDRLTVKFDPIRVSTVRPDLFQNESFSIFDILVYLDSTGRISLASHFNSDIDTYIIDSLNGETNWWYHVFYDGGQIELNAVRMDHYPWKPGTTIILYQESTSYINHVYSTFEEEVTRLANNNGTVVIPTVTINGSSFNVEFYNVSVTPHNLRNETLQYGVITALDVIMTLGDLGNITYELE